MITRLSEHICEQIYNGEWEATYDWLSNAFVAQSIGRGLLVEGEEEKWRDSWCLRAWRGGFLFTKKKASVGRGHEFNLPISDGEQVSLYDAYAYAKEVQKRRRAIDAEAKEAERNRLTDWP